MTALGRTV